MTYMEIHCGSCGRAWRVEISDNYHQDTARTCPRCAAQIDRQTWDKQVLPALGSVHDANFELARDATGYKDGKPFTINVLSGAEPGKGTK